MNDRSKPRFATLCIHAGHRPSPEHPELVPGIQRSSTFLQHAATHALTDAGHWDRVPVYTRYSNPTLEQVEARLARLEGAERALVFASGMAALHAAVLATVPVGGRVLAARELYGGSSDLLEAGLAQQGRVVQRFSLFSEVELERALQGGADLVLVETLSNPTLRVANLPAVARAVHAAGALLLVDATFTSPALSQPMEQGADLVMHSASKYLGGHSDLIGGVVSGSAQPMDEVWNWRKRGGGVLDPGAGFLLDRGVRTLQLRMAAQGQGAARLARALVGHPGLTRVVHPSLPDHPDCELAKSLFDGPPALVSIELAAGDAALRPFVSRLRLAMDAPSLGGVETLVSLPRYMSHAALSDEERRYAGIGPGFVRISVGAEDPEDLIEDFVGALDG